MTSFDVRPHDRAAGRKSATPAPDGYLLHTLRALDGVLIYVTRRGEHVGTYFGANERAAAAAAALDLVDIESGNDDEVQS